MQAYETLTISTAGAVVRVDLNRPAKGNRLNPAMWQELKQVFRELAVKTEVRVVILGGAGNHLSTQLTHCNHNEWHSFLDKST